MRKHDMIDVIMSHLDVSDMIQSEVQTRDNLSSFDLASIGQILESLQEESEVRAC